MTEGDNLAELWVNFLLIESQDKEEKAKAAREATAQAKEKNKKDASALTEQALSLGRQHLSGVGTSNAKGGSKYAMNFVTVSDSALNGASVGMGFDREYNFGVPSTAEEVESGLGVSAERVGSEGVSRFAPLDVGNQERAVRSGELSSSLGQPGTHC